MPRPRDASKRVVPYVMDTKNALVMRVRAAPVGRRDGEPAGGVQGGHSEALPARAARTVVRADAEPQTTARRSCSTRRPKAEPACSGSSSKTRPCLPLLARRALEVCHFDPDTLEDEARRPAARRAIECLLDYGNQPDHQGPRPLSRFATCWRSCRGAECRPAGGTGSRAERMAALRKRCDSKLETAVARPGGRLMLRPPSDAQYLIESCSTRPDFFYREHNAAIYIDGPPHDEPDQIRAG